MTRDFKKRIKSINKETRKTVKTMVAIKALAQEYSKVATLNREATIQLDHWKDYVDNMRENIENADAYPNSTFLSFPSHSLS